MDKNNNLIYGLGGVILGVICLKWMREDVFSILGLFDVSGKTCGIVFLVVGGWNLLVSDGFGELLGKILTVPIQILGWALGLVLEYWYLVVAAIALLFWLKPGQGGTDRTEAAIKLPEWTAPIVETVWAPWATEPEETVWVPPATTVPEETVWTPWGTEPEETVWVPPATTAPPADYIQQPYAGMHKEAGTCRNLREDAMILLVFVNDSASTWTDQEIRNYLSNNVEPGLDFIEYRASEYGYDITVEKCVYPDESGNTKTMYYDGTVQSWAPGVTLTGDLVSRAAETYGFAATDDMIQNVRDYAGTDQVGIVFCLDKEGRSYAQWHDVSRDFAEFAVVFTRQNGTKTRAEVVAHEVMHLFGADDMYTENTDRANRAAMAKRLHPRELFYQGQWNLYDNVISSYTAYAVGWLDALPEQYDCAEWWS